MSESISVVPLVITKPFDIVGTVISLTRGCACGETNTGETCPNCNERVRDIVSFKDAEYVRNTGE